MHYQRVGRTCSSGQRVRAAPADVMAPHAYETSADCVYTVITVYIRGVLSPIGVRITIQYAILLVVLRCSRAVSPVTVPVSRIRPGTVQAVQAPARIAPRVSWPRPTPTAIGAVAESHDLSRHEIQIDHVSIASAQAGLRHRRRRPTPRNDSRGRHHCAAACAPNILRSIRRVAQTQPALPRRAEAR